VKLLSFDVSTKTGFAVINETQGKVDLVERGLLKLPQKVSEYGSYPWSYLEAAQAMASMLMEKVYVVEADVLVIEETNLGRQRYTQKVLEFLHLALLLEINRMSNRPEVYYLSTSKWRSALGLSFNTADKRNNKLLRKAKDRAELVGTAAKLAEEKKALGVKGKVTPKHLAVRYVNDKFGLALKIKDNDQADAICLIMGFLAGAEHCTGND
jgi:hypothetical protein